MRIFSSRQKNESKAGQKVVQCDTLTRKSVKEKEGNRHGTAMGWTIYKRNGPIGL